MDSTIRDKVLYCSKLFEQAPVESFEVQDARKRFVEWYTNIAAHRVGTASLDERLRDAPDIRAGILRFLDILVTAFKYHSRKSPDSSKSSKRNQPLDILVDKAASSKPSSLMHKVVESLIRISIAIRTPASVDRYAKAEKVNVDHFYPTDKGHIDELFPKAVPILRERLLRAVLSRRRFLQYTQEHKEKLAMEAPFQQDEKRDETLLAEEKSEFADTMATPFSPDILIDDITPIGVSDSASDGAASDVSDSSSIRSDMSARVPPMPPMGQEGKPFECPCCFLMIEAKNRGKWKRHVFSDMRPYVCTFTDCKEPDRLFSSRHDWYSHELAFHRRTWVCISGCLRQFTSESAYETHLRATHEEFEDTAQAEKHGAHSRQLPEPKVPTCPICGDEIRYPELIRTHIGRHQAQLGLWPLRSMRYFDDEDDEEVDEEDEENCAEVNDEEDEDGQVEQQEGEGIKVEEDVYGQGQRREEDGTKPSQDTATVVRKELAEQQEQAGSDSPPPGSTEAEPVFSYSDYTVGWICPLPIELTAAIACLDVRHEDMPNIPGDDHNYCFGQISGHNIVIGVLPMGDHGPTPAALLAANMTRSFPQIRFIVLVGIGGGVPLGNHDVRLGDVVVSYPSDTHGGVMQFDMGKRLQDGAFQRTRHLNSPPRALLVAVASLETESELRGHGLKHDIQSILAKNPQLRNHYSRPDSSSDRLYLPSYIHASDGPCELDCDAKYEIARRKLDEDDDSPAVHYGLIASGHLRVKDAGFRDQLAQEKGVICFEMEAAGVMNSFPCIVIRGICDYCDSHGNQQWHGYAALSAAVYARALLRKISLTDDALKSSNFRR
ncbi:uncharacterized protein TrAFT101_004742 [Trichoderma asperellum]|uniref:uncharacterized protein n=1 Tax=Trichoderma asperellum TaxID=101201 RepID=UPI00331BC22D|nr:hypothetical protein TrAFT101_004742 [Trichoderma asperellum]